MSLLFYIFSGVMLVFGLLVVVNRNPVSSALSLVVSFMGLAALFITLNAYFIGVIQILVYTGAVMVLFLFIIMLLDIKSEQCRKLNYVAMGGGVMIVLAFVAQLTMILAGYAPGKQRLVELPGDAAVHQDVKRVGEALFTHFNFHLQLLGVLLLIATIGVVVLSRRQGEGN